MGVISYADRSRVLRGQHCPRAQWLEYGVPNGTPIPGVVPTRLNSDLVIGSGFHVGVEGLLTGASPDESVGRALQGYGSWAGFWPQVEAKGLILTGQEDAGYVYKEGAAIIEALIRGYAKFCLPELLERFDVVEVEREGSAQWTDGDFTLVWGYRADALLVEKDSQDIYVLSLKTSKDFGKKKQDTATRDMQGLSEVAAIDQRLLGWHEDLTNLTQAGASQASIDYLNIPPWFVKRFSLGASPSCFGVKMEYALKGLKLETPKGSGVWKYSNPLINPWKYAEDLGGKGRRAGLGSSGGYAISYDFQDELGGNHRLGKGWNRINIWEDMGVKEWIDYCWETSIQNFSPGHAITSQFALPSEYYRSDEDIARWKKRMIYAAKRREEGTKAVVAAIGTPEYEDRLDEYFEPHSNACDYPVKCVYQGICYGPKAYLINPLSEGNFEARTSNHEATELITIQSIQSSAH